MVKQAQRQGRALKRLENLHLAQGPVDDLPLRRDWQEVAEFLEERLYGKQEGSAGNDGTDRIFGDIAPQPGHIGRIVKGRAGCPYRAKARGEANGIALRRGGMHAIASLAQRAEGCQHAQGMRLWNQDREGVSPGRAFHGTLGPAKRRIRRLIETAR